MQNADATSEALIGEAASLRECCARASPERGSADSAAVEGGIPYSKVVVRTDKICLGEDAVDGYTITPGMGATVDIHTGTKSVLEYMVRPVLKLKSEAFRER